MSNAYITSASPYLTYEEWRGAAHAFLPKPIFDYVDGAAEMQQSLAANEAALAAVRFMPRVCVDVSERDLTTTVLGVPLPAPIICAPAGQNRIIRPLPSEGDLAYVGGATAYGTIAGIATATNTSVEDIVAAVPDAALWFQLYMPHDKGGVDPILDRVAAAGVKALCLTVDTPVPGWRLDDVRNAMAFPPVVDDHDWWRDRPEWTAMYTSSPPISNPHTAHLPSTMSVLNSHLTWSDVEWLRRRWAGSLVIKGVVRADDARRAVDCGVDGIAVSNHGGRQLDSMPGTLECLPAVLDAVGGRNATVEVYVDGGVRRGLDVLKAVALGARAVLIGRPYVWALAVDGARGVETLLRQYHAEMDRGLALLGCPHIADLDETFLA